MDVKVRSDRPHLAVPHIMCRNGDAGKFASGTTRRSAARTFVEPYAGSFRQSDGEPAMSAASGAMPRFIDELNQIGGLSGSDIANITNVSKATVSRWKAGTVKPQPGTQLVLSDLYYVVSRLQDYYISHEIRIWLYARHPQLDGARAIDLINDNRSEDVLRVLDRLDADAYL